MVHLIFLLVFIFSIFECSLNTRAMRFFYSFMLILWVTSFGISGGSAFAQTVIPFTLSDHNNMLVKAVVNDTDSLHLMFQVAMKDAAISPQRIRPAKTLSFDQGISKGNTIQIAGLKKNDITFFDNELSGPGSDGKIGTGLFAGKVFMIDYNNSQFVMYDQLPELQGYQSIPIHVRDEALFVDVTSFIGDSLVPHSFFLQSGYSGGLLYDDTFSAAQHLDTKLVVRSEKTLKNSAGASVTTKQASLGRMKIGETSLQNMSVGFFVGNLKTQPFSFFGADLLKRFNWIFDADRKTAYIRPSKYIDATPFELK